MLEKVITNAVKAYDEEVRELIFEGEKVTIVYTDGDYYTGEIRIDGSTILLDFHRTFIIRIGLTVTM